MAPDMEARSHIAIGAMHALTLLVDGQTKGMTIASEDLSPLLHCVFAAVKRAVPTHFVPIGANDEDDDGG